MDCSSWIPGGLSLPLGPVPALPLYTIYDKLQQKLVYPLAPLLIAPHLFP